MSATTSFLETAQKAVGIGVELLTSTEPGAIHTKGDRDLVTDLDLRIQREISSYLENATPDVGFLGEENIDTAADPLIERFVWALDPIDGTSNFAHGLPLCAVSLALLEYGKPIVGVIEAPFLDLKYHATKNGGAFRGEIKIRAGETTELGKAIVSLGDYAVGEEAAQKNRQRIALTSLFADNVERIRMFGAATLDLVWVAEGHTDACVILSNKPWDTAAGVLIAREAGALVTDVNGAQHDYQSKATIAAAPGVSAQLLDLISRAVAE